jgi:hypothetical protein
MFYDRRANSVSIEFSNEIADLPPLGEHIPKKFVETPPEVQAELDKEREHREADFRKWLIKNKPKNAVMTPIETSTATGVPDIFCCYGGFSSWVECKITISGKPKFRGTQYVYLKKLIEAGGHAKIAVQYINSSSYKPASIHIYDAERLLSFPSGMFKAYGQDMIFPQEAEPYCVWYYNRNKDCDLQDLYDKLLLDTVEFTW